MRRVLTRSLTLAAVLIVLPAKAERRFFPVTGDATIGGSYGHFGQFNANLFVGYSHGVQLHPHVVGPPQGVPPTNDSLSGLTFALGPQYTYRSWHRESIGCRSLEKDKDGKTIEKDDGCADGYSYGVLARVGLAFLTDEDHHAPDHLLYVGVNPFVGREPQLSFEDGYMHDRATRGVRFTAGYNFFAFSRLIVDTIVNGTSSKNDAMNVIVLPAALISKVEFQFDIVRVQDGRSENRFGFAIGFGF